MNSDQIRKLFTDFFVAREHKLIPSSSLVPHGDPTLLFTSAGMVQFKPYFMGLAEPPAPRMTSVQKCFRTSDVASVGDYSHLTFFEMLGNFSVGDYFKDEAIAWAWELVTKDIAIPPERLWTSVYLDDDDAFAAWRKQGVPAERIMRYGEEDNYWFSGETGPCGPCSEIHYDLGPEAGCRQADCQPSHSCGRFFELWNLVFMTYYQQADGSRTPLPKKNIDTGAGLERWAVVLQGKDNVYDTDLFRPIVAKVEELAGIPYEGAEWPIRHAMRVVAEHVRAAAFLIADGVIPSNEGRGYVLRRLFRRAVYFATRLGPPSAGAARAWLAPAAEAVVGLMSPAYPELAERRDFIKRVMETEEEKFRQTLEAGLRYLRTDLLGWRRLLLSELDGLARAVEEPVRVLQKTGLMINALQGAAERLRAVDEAVGEVTGPMRPAAEAAAESALRPVREARSRLAELAAGGPAPLTAAVQEAVERSRSAAQRLSGKEAFVLHDTYGFPKELTLEVAAEQGFTLDEEGFEQEMAAQRERARAGTRFEVEEVRFQAYASLAHIQPRFVGYDTLRRETTVAAIIGPAGVAESAEAGEEVEVVLLETPFYAESGGQVGDQGEIVADEGRFIVEDTQAAEGLILHRGRIVERRLAVNDTVVAQVDAGKRADTMRNHTATHLLHAALRQVLGQHVRQAGSLVAPDRLRFDFTHIEAPSPEELARVEEIVNEKIRTDLPVQIRYAPYEEAIAEGAMALFGEKYAAEVRVVEMPEADTRFSMELCGGTHCQRSGQIGSFLILSEGSIGAGLRRIEAVTGRVADEYVRNRLGILETVSAATGAPVEELPTKVNELQQELQSARRRVQALEREADRRAVEPLLAQAERVDSAAILAARVPAGSFEAMREMGDWLRDRLGSAVVVLGAVFGERPNFLAMVTRDLSSRGVHAGELIKKVAAVTGGGGGGRPEMAQAGGKDAGRLDEALRLASSLAREALAAAQRSSSGEGGERS